MVTLLQQRVQGRWRQDDAFAWNVSVRLHGANACMSRCLMCLAFHAYSGMKEDLPLPHVRFLEVVERHRKENHS
jgi:hypothetical protein